MRLAYALVHLLFWLAYLGKGYYSYYLNMYMCDEPCLIDNLHLITSQAIDLAHLWYHHKFLYHHELSAVYVAAALYYITGTNQAGNLLSVDKFSIVREQ